MAPAGWQIAVVVLRYFVAVLMLGEWVRTTGGVHRRHRCVGGPSNQLLKHPRPGENLDSPGIAGQRGKWTPLSQRPGQPSAGSERQKNRKASNTVGPGTGHGAGVADFEAGMGARALASKYGVNRSTVWVTCSPERTAAPATGTGPAGTWGSRCDIWRRANA
jgi:hypothetical protein